MPLLLWLALLHTPAGSPSAVNLAALPCSPVQVMEMSWSCVKFSTLLHGVHVPGARIWDGTYRCRQAVKRKWKRKLCSSMKGPSWTWSSRGEQLTEAAGTATSLRWFPGYYQSVRPVPLRRIMALIVA